MLEQLIQLGFNEEEAELYIAMLELGGGYASQLAMRVKRNRSSCYHTLKRLVDKGVTTKVAKGSYQYFTPEPPEKIVHLAKLRFDAASTVLPELLSIQNNLRSKPKIKYFERESGIEAIFDDTLSAKGEILGYTNLTLLIDLFPGYFRRYTKERMKQKIKVRYLSPKPEQGIEFIEEFLTQGFDRALLEILFVNPSQFPFKNEIAIYGEKVAFMSLSREEKIGILVESQTVSSTMRAIFDLAWIGASAFIAQ